MPVVHARHAMATRFEIVLPGENPVALRAAGEEALEEIERLEARLSLYQPASEIARVNARAAQAPVRVSPDVFRLLECARRLHGETAGGFDITVAPLVRCWGFMGGRGQMPDPEEVAAARACVGMHQVELNAEACTVRFARDGVMLDLGAIGKGYAIDCAAGILREAGVRSALLHGGTSTTYAIGQPPGAEAWNVGIEWGAGEGSALAAAPEGAHRDQAPRPGATDEKCDADARVDRSALLAVVSLRDESLSVSAVWGRAFETGGRVYGHVIDPRTGEPVSRADLAAVVLPSATETDALSTALLTLGAEGLPSVSSLRAGIRAHVAGRTEGTGRVWIEAHGIAPRLDRSWKNPDPERIG